MCRRLGLCPIAYRALTGHQPFKGEEAAVILVSVLSHMPVRPSSLVEVPPEIDLALAIALAKQPTKRFRSAAALADALEGALGGELSAAQRKRASHLLRAHPWAED